MQEVANSDADDDDDVEDGISGDDASIYDAATGGNDKCEDDGSGKKRWMMGDCEYGVDDMRRVDSDGNGFVYASHRPTVMLAKAEKEDADL